MTTNYLVLTASETVKTTIRLGVEDTTATVAASAVAGTTLAALQAGSTSYKYIAAIEGYPYLLTDATLAYAIQAWSGTDWVQALGGLYVELDNEQSITPWEPFNGGGTCTLRVQADSTDQFGIDTHRKAAGAETVATATMNRAATSINVSTGTAMSAGDVYIGTECVGVGSADPTTLWINARGKYSPFASGGTGGARFAEHHRVLNDPNTVRMNPVVSAQPRVWVGKRIGVWMHKVDGTGLLNSKSDAQCVFAGRIAGVADDPQTGYTVVDCKHDLDSIKDATIGRDFWGANLVQGLFIKNGLSFTITDYVSDTAAGNTSNALTVVASGASGTNQMNEGYYSLEEVCSILNSWLGQEKASARIAGFYTWSSPVTDNSNGFRTTCKWRVPNGALTFTRWELTMPGQVASFLGCTDDSAAQSGSSQQVKHRGIASQNVTYTSPAVPWRTVFFSLGGPGINLSARLESERGSFVDQYSLLPAIIKQGTQSSTGTWGIFLLDEKYLIVGSYSQGLLSDCFLTPYVSATGGQLTIDGGRRADDTTSGPVTIRQVYILESTFGTLLKSIFYSSGVAGYNSATYDTLGYSLGIGIPGELLGEDFDRSVDNLPGSSTPIACLIDEPTTLSKIFAGDMLLRHAFIVWKNGGFQFGTWQTPLAELSTLTLTESNKAEPSGSTNSHRSATTLSDEWLQNTVKIDYNRDITFGKDGTYLSSITLEDQVSVDDRGGDAKPFTIKARNTMRQSANTGAGLESLIPGFLATLPMFSRSARRTTRSIDIRAFEGVAPGDICLITDSFARDPATGTRGISARAAIITKHRYNPGGPTPGDPSQVNPPIGEIDVFFLDLHRSALYAPTVQVDDTMNTEGFTSGYNLTTNTLAMQAHQHSLSSTTSDATNGEAYDITRFVAGERIIITQIDPDSPVSYLSWTNTITTVSGAQMTLQDPLSGFDTTKKYRVTFDRYSSVLAPQQAWAYQADATSGLIESVGQPFQWSSTSESETATANAVTDYAEFLPACAYGNGRALDVGHERAIARTLNSLIDYKTAHQSPALTNNWVGSDPSPSLDYILKGICPVFTGLEQEANMVARWLIVAPIVKWTPGIASSVRVTLSRTLPIMQPGSSPGSYDIVVFTDAYTQATWSSEGESGTSVIHTLPDKQLNLLAKDGLGMAWLCVELFGAAKIYGYGKLIEGPRFIPA